MDIKLVTGKVVSGVVNTSKLNVRSLTHIILSNIKGDHNDYNEISVKFTFDRNQTHTMQIPLQTIHPQLGHVYEFSEFEDIIVSIDIKGVDSEFDISDKFTSLYINDSRINLYTRPLELGEQTLLTAYNLPVGSKLYFNGNDWKTGTSVESFGVKPSFVYIDGERIGAMLKNIQGDSTLYYKNNGTLYIAKYGNMGDCGHGLTKTEFTLV